MTTHNIHNPVKPMTIAQYIVEQNGDIINQDAYVSCIAFDENTEQLFVLEPTRTKIVINNHLTCRIKGDDSVETIEKHAIATFNKIAENKQTLVDIVHYGQNIQNPKCHLHQYVRFMKYGRISKRLYKVETLLKNVEIPYTPVRTNKDITISLANTKYEAECQCLYQLEKLKKQFANDVLHASTYTEIARIESNIRLVNHHTEKILKQMPDIHTKKPVPIKYNKPKHITSGMSFEQYICNTNGNVLHTDVYVTGVNITNTDAEIWIVPPTRTHIIPRTMLSPSLNDFFNVHDKTNVLNDTFKMIASEKPHIPYIKDHPELNVDLPKLVHFMKYTTGGTPYKKPTSGEIQYYKDDIKTHQHLTLFTNIEDATYYFIEQLKQVHNVFKTLTPDLSPHIRIAWSKQLDTINNHPDYKKYL